MTSTHLGVARPDDLHAWTIRREGSRYVVTIYERGTMRQLMSHRAKTKAAAIAWGDARVATERTIRRFLTLPASDNPRAEYLDSPDYVDFPPVLDALRDYASQGDAALAAIGLTVDLVADRLDWIAGRTVTL